MIFMFVFSGSAFSAEDGFSIKSDYRILKDCISKKFFSVECLLVDLNEDGKANSKDLLKFKKLFSQFDFDQDGLIVVSGEKSSSDFDGFRKCFLISLPEKEKNDHSCFEYDINEDGQINKEDVEAFTEVVSLDLNKDGLVVYHLD